MFMTLWSTRTSRKILARKSGENASYPLRQYEETSTERRPGNAVAGLAQRGDAILSACGLDSKCERHCNRQGHMNLESHVFQSRLVRHCTLGVDIQCN